MPAASSCIVVLPRMTAPASRSRFTWKASAAGCSVARPSAPPDVGMPAVSKLSFTSTGMPCSGPRGAGGRALAIERVGLVARARVDEHDGVQPGPGLVVGPDSRQVRLDQSSRGDLAGGLRRLELEDGLLEHLEQRPRGRGRRGRRFRPSLPGERRRGESGQQGRHGQAAGETASDHGAYCSGGPGARRRSRASRRRRSFPLANRRPKRRPYFVSRRDRWTRARVPRPRSLT